MTSLSAVSVTNECASWGDGHLPLVSQFQIFYSALWCWAWHSASHISALPPHPLGSASRRRSRETGWLEEGGGSSLFIAVPHTLVVVEGSSLQLLGALPESASSYLLGGTSISQTVPNAKGAEFRLPDAMGSFLRDPKTPPPARSCPLPRELSPSSKATLPTTPKLFPPDLWFLSVVLGPVTSASPG